MLNLEFIDDELLRLFLHEKPVLILLGIRYNGGKAYPALLSRYAECTYAHAVKILDFLEESGLIKKEKEGKMRYVMLTEKGEEISFILEQLITTIINYSKEREKKEKEK